MLGIGRAAAYQAANRGEIPTLRIGRRLLVPLHRLEQLLGLHNEDEARVGSADLVKNAGGGGGYETTG